MDGEILWNPGPSEACGMDLNLLSYKSQLLVGWCPPPRAPGLFLGCNNTKTLHGFVETDKLLPWIDFSPPVLQLDNCLNHISWYFITPEHNPNIHTKWCLIYYLCNPIFSLTSEFLTFHLSFHFYQKLLYFLSLTPSESWVYDHKRLQRGKLQKQVDEVIVSVKNQHNVPCRMVTQC